MLATLLVVSMAIAGVSNSLVLAKKSDSNNDGNSDSGSGDSNNGGSDNSGSKDSGKKVEEAKPTEHIDAVTTSDTNNDNSNGVTQDNIIKNPSPITPAPCCFGPDKPSINFGCHFHPNDDRCKPAIPGQCPGGFASNDKGNCHPIGPCPPGFSRHDDDESGQCFHNPGNFHFPFHKTIIIHKTKVIHQKDVIHTTTVFVPGIGLVEPFNCKLNDNNGKISCEFLIIKVIK